MTDAKHHPDDDSRFAPPSDADVPIADTNEDDVLPVDELADALTDDPFAPLPHAAMAPADDAITDEAPFSDGEDEDDAEYDAAEVAPQADDEPDAYDELEAEPLAYDEPDAYDEYDELEAEPLAYDEPAYDPEATVELGATAPIRITPADEYNSPNLDIDGALAAVSGLDDMLAQQEAEERAEEERLEAEYRAEQARLEAERLQQEAEDRARAEAEERVRDLVERKLPAPQPLELGRGSVASLLPGLALVGVGVWLTVGFTTETAPPPLTVIGALAGIAALALVSAWLGAGRWHRGGLFFVLWGALSVGAVVYAVTAFGMALAPTALLAALGLALLLAGVLARPASLRFALSGIALLVAAAVTAVASLGYVPAAVLQTAAALWIPVVVLVGILLVLPLVRALRR